MSTLLECISLRVHQYTYSRSDNSKIINSHDCDTVIATLFMGLSSIILIMIVNFRNGS